jgi:MoaA/NifB/PqqE/SkfB family radical SAM enzyme
MIDYAVNRGLQTELTTNASLLDTEKADFLVTGNVRSVHCSINAGSAETYARITGTGDRRLFDRVKENIRTLVRMKRAMGRHLPKIMLSFVLTSENHYEAESAARFAIETGAERISYVPVSIYYRNMSFLALGPQEKRSLFCILGNVKSLLNRHGLDHNVDEVLRDIRGDGVDSMDRLYRYFPCYVGWYFSLVFANGTVLPCCQCLKNMGNLHEHSFKEIWNNSAYEAYRSETVNLPVHKKPPSGCLCPECSFGNYNLFFHRISHPLVPISIGDEKLRTLALIRSYFSKR